MNNKILLKIITPHNTFFNDYVNIFTVKTLDGYIGIMKGHIPLMTSIEISQLHIELPNSSNFRSCAIATGILYVEKEVATIITDAIEYKEEINLSRALSAKNRLEKLLQSKTNKSENAKYEVALAKAINRINTKKD